MKLRTTFTTWQEAVRFIANAFNTRNHIGTVTLTNSSTTTVVNDGECTSVSCITLTPLNANAAAENPYISNRATGTFTITHSSAGTTRQFSYSITNP